MLAVHLFILSPKSTTAIEFRCDSAEEAKIAIVKVEGITERVIAEVEVLLIGASLDLPLNICPHLPKQAPQPSLPVHKHHAWLKAATHHNTHRYPFFTADGIKDRDESKVRVNKCCRN